MFSIESLQKSGYLGFSYRGKHSSEFGIYRTSSGGRYNETLSPEFSNTTISVPGRAGEYYFGVQYGNKFFDLDLAFIDVSERMKQRIAQWLNPESVGQLVLDESPYMYHNAKISAPVNFSFVPFFEDEKIGTYYIPSRTLKGTANIQFVATDPFGYSAEVGDFNFDSMPIWALASGRIPYDFNHSQVMFPLEKQDIRAGQQFNIYNGGTAPAKAEFHFEVLPYSDTLKIMCLEKRGEVIEIGSLDKILKVKTALPNNIISLWEIFVKPEGAWALGRNSDRVAITEPTLLGHAHNHYFPYIYPVRPMEVLALDQVSPFGQYNNMITPIKEFTNNYCVPSDMTPDEVIFDPLPKEVMATYGCASSICFFVNSWFHELGGYSVDLDNINQLGKNQLCFMLSPSRFNSNKDLLNFTPGFKFTYQ